MRYSFTRTVRYMGAVMGALLITAGFTAAPAAATPAQAQSVIVEQSGGIAGVQSRFTVDSLTDDTRRNPLLTSVQQPEFLALDSSYVASDTACCDRFVYEITVRYPNGTVKSVITMDGSGAPAILRQAIEDTKAISVAAGTARDLTSQRSLLFVELTPDPMSPTTLWSISCTTGGPNPAVCGSLNARTEAALAPIPTGTACTRIYGGPQVAKVFGVWQGEWVSAQFNRLGGCEITRWDTAAALLTPVA